MLVIGLCGTIGSGKSTIAGFMQELGANIIDTDVIGHEAYLPHSFGWQKIVEVFGEHILSPNQYVDRRKLGDIVFDNHAALEHLNYIVRPLVFKSITDRLNELQSSHEKVVVMEAALLIEAGWESLVDEIWVVTSPENVIYKRLSIKRNLTSSQVKKRINAHLPVAEQLKHATHVIDTDLPLDVLREKVATLWKEFVLPRIE